MRSTRPAYATILSLFLILFTTTILARAADDEGDEYDVKARVVRIRLMTGNVNLKRSGNTDWERARLNFPLVEGDTLSTDRDSRVEIQIDARNFVRLASNSILRIVTLRDEGVALSVLEGTASVRLAKFDRDHEYFEVDAPKTTLAAEKKGLYRIDVSRDGRVRLSARDGGRARIYSETSGFALRDGRTAELIYEGADAGDWEFLAANASDSWDNWVDSRERYLAERLRYDVQYYDSYVWGAEDLDAYGDWTYANDYGWIWRPHTTVINNYYNWAPYRYGNWTWVEPYGWTWVGYEPWGWAPYHYGRWVYYNNYWAWCPRSHYYRHRSWWRPALVAFVSIHLSFGDSYCWYPLHYNQRDPHSRYYYQASNRLRAMRSDGLANLRRVNPAYLRAVTALPAKDFGADGARLRPADEVLARRVVNAEPLRTDLAVRPAYALNARGNSVDRAERIAVARPARVAPGVELSQRPTGAAVRSPGVALDDELRRARVLNGRDARPEFPEPTGGAGAIDARPTGAVARPARPLREADPRNDTGRDVNRLPERDERPARAARPVREADPRNDASREVNQSPEPEERPARPNRTIPKEDVPARPEPNERERGPARVPVRPPSNEEGSPADRTARPERTDRPERTRNDRFDQPARPESPEPARVERPERRERTEAPPRTEAPSQRNEPPPRYEPPQRSEPPPQRSEPPARYEPPQRNDPPPRSEPPPHSDPPPQGSEPPARSEPARTESDRPARKGEDPR